MKRRSEIFQCGQRVEGTMLTIVKPVYPDTWMLVEVECDCGNYIVLPYQRVYYRQYSCGCTRRVRSNALDYTNMSVHSQYGNRNEGRTLTVLFRDPGTQQWAYVCSCCAEVFVMPPGMERGLRSSLKEIAAQDCPNHLEYTPLERIEHLVQMIGGTKNSARIVIAEQDLEPRYEQKNIKRDARGQIVGFYGPPRIFPEDLERIRKNREAYRIANAPVPIDPDGFGPMDDIYK
jgi:hypothetical protein